VDLHFGFFCFFHCPRFDSEQLHLMCFPFLTCFRSECDPQYSNGECFRYYRRQRRRHLVVMWHPVEIDGVRIIEAELEDHLPLAAKREVDLGLVLIKYTCTHQHIVVPSNRLIFRRAVLVHASWQTLHHCRPFWRDEVRYRVSRSHHAVIAGKAILFRRQFHTMQSRLQRI